LDTLDDEEDLGPEEPPHVCPPLTAQEQRALRELFPTPAPKIGLGCTYVWVRPRADGPVVRVPRQGLRTLRTARSSALPANVAFGVIAIPLFGTDK